VGGKQTVRLAVAAAIAGVAWGYLRHRKDPRAGAFAFLQGLEWFIAYGGAAAIIEVVREAMEGDHDLEVTERLTRVRQTVVDGAAGD
jgi:hypothetical protein